MSICSTSENVNDKAAPARHEPLQRTNFSLVAQKIRAGEISVAREAPHMMAFVERLSDAAQLKECKAQAAAIAEYLAQRKDGSVEEYNAAVKIKAKVEYRLGEVLAETVNHQGGKAAALNNTVLPKEITPMQSSRAQRLARVPWEEIETRIDACTEKNERAVPTQIAREIKDVERTIYRQERAASVIAMPEEIRVGDFRSVLADLPDGSVDLIFSDPPYTADCYPIYGDLAALAARLLTPGGSLVAYVPPNAMANLLSRMTPHLSYWAALGIRHTGQLPRLNYNRLIVRAKFLAWFVNGRYDGEWVMNLIDSQPGDKDLHDWAQGTAEATYCIERMCPPGGLVLDPMCGSGTTLVAARQLGRKFLGVELDPERAKVAASVLQDLT